MKKVVLLIRQNLINRGEFITRRMATALVLLSSILPFLNNLVRRFYDTEAIVFDNVSGAKSLNLDSCIFFISMPLSYLFIAIGARAGADKKSFYAVFVSSYFQLVFILQFIFLDINNIYIFSQISLFAIFLSIGLVMYFVEKYLKNKEIEDEFKEKALDRYSEMLMKRGNDEEDR